MDKSNLPSDAQKNKSKGIPIFPIPDNAPKLSQSSVYKYFSDLFKGNADYYYPYRNAQGEILGYIIRWDTQKSGEFKKEIRPFIYCEFPGGKRKWYSQGFPALRPLFNLDKLAQLHENTVLSGNQLL